MDLFEKINRAFGGWYEGLFGQSDDVRPKDILRKILVAMEEHRKEGFDSKIYVPNQYVLEIAVDDEEEKEYLLSFLDREELETALRRYCQQNNYHVRGGLDFTIKEIEAQPDSRKREKVRVRCRYDSKITASKIEPAAGQAPPEPAPVEIDDQPTVFEVAGDSDSGTVPAVALATLEVRTSGKPSYEVTMARGALAIGRSARAGNHIVLESDGMVSRRHARVEMESDGRFTLYDLETTNGTKVNGRRVSNAVLNSGDEIELGATRILFRQHEYSEPEGDSGPHRPTTQQPSSRARSMTIQRPNDPTTQRPARPARLVLLDGDEIAEEFVLASETVVGRALTNDIVLHDRSVAARHARLRRGEPFTLESLASDARTTVNGMTLSNGSPSHLTDGDRIELGRIALRFEGDRR